MTRILYYPGMLKIQSGNKRRRIACRCTSLDDPERIGPFARFVIQFTCDDPLFNDFEDTVEPVYERNNHLYGNIANSAWDTNGKLAFSTRLSGADLLNKGDSPCEPVFTVTNNEPLGLAGRHRPAYQKCHHRPKAGAGIYIGKGRIGDPRRARTQNHQQQRG